MTKIKLPKGFLIGAATAAHQVEGDNIHSDYWALENMELSEFKEPSLKACDHYRLYQEDIQLMKDAGLTAYRFSIEWARIEPEKGCFDEKEMQHYLDVIECCKEKGIVPFVTLHHFTSPKWLIREGGWESEAVLDYFKKYVSYVMDHISDKVEYICTINEANMGIQIAAIMERYKKAAMGGEGNVQVGIDLEALMAAQEAKKKIFMETFGVDTPHTFVSARTKEGDELVMQAHIAAREIIKAKNPEIKVGITLSLHCLEVEDGGEAYATKEWEDEFTHYLPAILEDDFFGLQNYTCTRYGKEGMLPNKEGAELTQMGYEYYPEGLAKVIRKVNEVFKKDIYITENGIATDNDERRISYITTALEGVSKCIEEGCPVKGYMHWSLMDNFEWQMGFSQTFGLIAVNRETMERKPKDSLYYLGNIAKNI